MKTIAIHSRIFRWDERARQAIKSVLGQTYPHFIYYIEVNQTTKSPIEKQTLNVDNVILLLRKEGDKIGFSKNSYEMTRKADYICTLDGDDTLAPDFLETQLQFCEEYNLDISCCAVDFIDENGEAVGHRSVAKKTLIIDKSRFIELFPHYLGAMRPIWGKLFKTSLFEEHMWDDFPLSDTYGGYGGDTKVSLELLKRASKVGFHPKVGYYYFAWSQSVSHKWTKGREHSPEFFYHMLYDFYKHFGEPLSPKSFHTICVFHLGSLIDMLPLIQNLPITTEEKLEKLFSVFASPLIKQSVDEVVRSELNDSNVLRDVRRLFAKLLLSTWFCTQIPAYRDQLFDIFLTLYPHYASIENQELLKMALDDGALFSVLIDEAKPQEADKQLFTLWKKKHKREPDYAKFVSLFSKNVLFKFVTQNCGSDEFLRNNPKFLIHIFENNMEKAIEYIDVKLSNNSNDSLFYADILINLAAKENAQDLFIQAMLIKANLLKTFGDEISYTQILEELAEMGIVE